MALAYKALSGEHLDAALADLARLRIEVFRDWPYLYDGDPNYERRYMESYRSNERAILVAAFEEGQIVGAATGTPLEDHADDFAAALKGQGVRPAEVFYCAESVLLPAYRGQGAGHAFFEAREAHARRLGYRYSAFCAVIRPEYHPARPVGYQPLDGFWRRRGYEMVPGAIAEFSWRDVGDAEETPKKMQFWMRAL